MSGRREFAEKLKTDHDFKTVLEAVASLIITGGFGLYHGFLGLHYLSLWHGSICGYYLILIILRGFILFIESRVSKNPDRKRYRIRIYLVVSILLLLMNISLIVPVSLMAKFQKPVNMTLIPALAMALYTTYKIIVSSLNFRKRFRNSDNLLRLLRTISFIDALVSILTLQNTLIMVSSRGVDYDMLPVTSISSTIIMIAIMILSLEALWKGICSIRGKE
ncbi:MAG: hypothetical protein K5989_05590 [Lachnospiraceae bacterium]|nr:hypothetical protein [Lachnospiraceae bacterium]